MTKRTPEEIIRDLEAHSEKADKIHQRELVHGTQQTAIEKKIFGLISLDGLERTFSRDPIVDPFAIDRSPIPLGAHFLVPRRTVHFVPPPTTGGAWKGVITLIESYVPEQLKPTALTNPNILPSGLKIETLKNRKPDWVRIEFPMPQSLVNFLMKHDFKAFLGPPEILFPEIKKNSAALARFGSYPVVPEALLSNIPGLTLKSTDWNGKHLSAIARAEHLMKHRNTVAAVLADLARSFRLELAPHAQLEVVFRDIEVDYKDLTVDIRKTTGARERVGIRELMASPDDADGFAKLQEVEETRTHYKKPLSYVTTRFRAEWNARQNIVVFSSKPAVDLPASSRERLVVKNGVETRIMEDLPYRKALEPVLVHITEVADSIEVHFPKFLAKLYRRG